MLVVEAAPLDEVFDVRFCFPMCNHALDVAVHLKLLLLSLLVEQERFDILTSVARVVDSRLPLFVRFDVVIHPLDAPKPFKKLIGLVGIMKVGKALPLNMKSL